MSNKISVQQRKYFSQRIEEAIDAKISVLKHKNASRVTELGNKQFENYLKDIGVYDKLMRYNVIKSEADELNKTIRQIYENIRRALNIGEYQNNWPTIYQGSDIETINQGFRKACEEVALQNSEGSQIGQEIEELEKQKRAATDLLHGVNELDGLTAEVNRILTGAGVPQLGE
jgi:malate synthase